MKLSSPNHPEPFNQNEDCTWEIIAPQGHYITLEFEIIDVCNKEFTLLQSDLAKYEFPWGNILVGKQEFYHTIEI